MKKDLGQRTSALRELADSPDILGPAGLSDSVDTENERRNRELYWRFRFLVQPVSCVDGRVELVLLPCGNARRLLRFMGQLDERLEDGDDYAGIMHMVGSWDRGVIITISLGSTPLSSLLEQLDDMPEVKKVEEEPLARDVFSSLRKKLGVLLNSSIGPSKRFCITLKETSMTRPELATVLN